MSKAFTKETDNEEPERPEIPANSKNYVTPAGFADLQEELLHLVRDERPKIVEIVRWAAGNGDRSENGDYIYGKKRLREIDRRVRYLTKQIKGAKIIDPAQQQGFTQVFFGATVTYLPDDDVETTVKLVGVDEADLTKGKISWFCPVAKALLKSRVGDVVELNTPEGIKILKIIALKY